MPHSKSMSVFKLQVYRSFPMRRYDHFKKALLPLVMRLLTSFWHLYVTILPELQYSVNYSNILKSETNSTFTLSVVLIVIAFNLFTLIIMSHLVDIVLRMSCIRCSLVFVVDIMA